jgi:hypothetical protein
MSGEGRGRERDSIKGAPRLPPILRSKFIAGLVILIPIIVTTKALVWLFTYLDDLADSSSRSAWCS